MLRRVGAAVAIALALFALGTAGVLGWWLLRPNSADVDVRLGLEHWSVVSDGLHNSNTDLMALGPDLLLVHAVSPYHLGTPRSRLVVKRSRDGRDWELLATLRVEGMDIRDPKFAQIGGRLFLYALPNNSIAATPEHTVYATSADAGRTWSGFLPVEGDDTPGWLFWRPRTRDGRTWYVSAYWHEHGASALFRSEDGVRWTKVSTIHEGGANDETAIVFLPDGRLLATARIEVEADGVLGHRDAHTVLAVAEVPFRVWQKSTSGVTRLDGPVLLLDGDTVFAVARYQPGPHGPLTRMASTLARKRTSLYRVEPDRLVWLSDLPSAGDTSYAGAVVRDDALFVEWYTSAVGRDYPWILGMFLPTEIRMARIPMDALRALSAATP